MQTKLANNARGYLFAYLWPYSVQVMESRGWKPSCPLRVPDEDLTNPYVEHWEEGSDIIDVHEANSSRREEPHRCILPAVAAADHSDGNGAAGPPSSDTPTTVAPPQQENHCASSSGRASQAWDLHWSYTKWAVETMRFARKLAPWQKVNHFRNSSELCRKVPEPDCALTMTTVNYKAAGLCTCPTR